MTRYQVQVPGEVRVGGGVRAELGEVLRAAGVRHPLIVADPVMVANGVVHELQSVLANTGQASAVFSDVRPDPTDVEVNHGVSVYRASAHDALVSVGGGSTIDTAKAIGVLIGNSGAIRDYKVPAVPPRIGPMHVAMPTTAGTGAEVTRFAVITDTEFGEKMLIAGAALLPHAALVDYELSRSMPQRVTADTGLDALTHAIEAYVSRRANAFSNALALEAMGTLWRMLPRVYADAQDREAREQMMSAATMAGMAFSNASVALVHGMSRPLGLAFHVAHGLSNAMLLPAVTRFSLPGAEEKYARCAVAMGIAPQHLSPRDAAHKLVSALEGCNGTMCVPTLAAHGVRREEYIAAISRMAQQALASGSPENNPRVPSQSEIEDIYRSLWA